MFKSPTHRNLKNFASPPPPAKKRRLKNLANIGPYWWKIQHVHAQETWENPTLWMANAGRKTQDVQHCEGLAAEEPFTSLKPAFWSLRSIFMDFEDPSLHGTLFDAEIIFAYGLLRPWGSWGAQTYFPAVSKELHLQAKSSRKQL